MVNAESRADPSLLSEGEEPILSCDERLAEAGAVESAVCSPLHADAWEG